MEKHHINNLYIVCKIERFFLIILLNVACGNILNGEKLSINLTKCIIFYYYRVVNKM